MTDYILTLADWKQFGVFLQKEERSRATVEKYLRDTRKFYEFLGEERKINKEKVIAYKAFLKETYKVSSANSMIAEVNCLLNWAGLGDFRVKSFKIQRQMFCCKEKVLEKEEYDRLVTLARENHNDRLELIMQTICSTGIRIGELPFITVEAAVQGVAKVQCKGKQRIIFIPDKLRIYLLDYCRRKQIGKGTIFITRSGRPMNRVNVWTEMKGLCEAAGVEWMKVYPHNLRHLFARTCYRQYKDIAYLADILGHSSIETTRIYTVSSGEEHGRMVSKLDLVL